MVWRPFYNSRYLEAFMCAQHPVNTSVDNKETQPRKQRYKLWELEERFHCSLIGTCLSLDELRQICRKAKIGFHTPPTDHELHSAFVNIAGGSVFATRLLQKHLDNKYKNKIREFKTAQTSSQLTPLWDAALQCGDTAAAFWALVSHGSTSKTLLDRAYGEIHMLSHLAGCSTRVDMQELTTLRHQVGRLKIENKQQTQLLQSQLKEKDALVLQLKKQKKQTEIAHNELHVAQQKLVELSDSSQLRQRLQTLTGKLMASRAKQAQNKQDSEQWQQQQRQTEIQNQHLQRSLDESQRECDALEMSMSSLLSNDCASQCKSDGSDCPNLDLCGRNILYVGGRNSQNSHFRTLVERANGRFMHHDGGREDSHCQLSAVLQKADAVLCPLDNISHNAVQRLKRFCKRNQKTLMLLPRSSLSAFSQGLNEVAA
jgi:hypothetical protein